MSFYFLFEFDIVNLNTAELKLGSVKFEKLKNEKFEIKFEMKSSKMNTVEMKLIGAEDGNSD